MLRRKLGDSDPRLQEQKITNLKQAVKNLNGVVILPGKFFSLWSIVGEPSAKNGYVNGMLLSGGKVIEGMGGGLCQLSNFLFWIFLHVPSEVVQRYHHSIDVFPDSGRVLPFGSGATILYNFIDCELDVEPCVLKWISNFNFLHKETTAKSQQMIASILAFFAAFRISFISLSSSSKTIVFTVK